MMASFRCPLFICSVLCAGVAGVQDKVPNGEDPFTLGKRVNPLEKVISVITEIRDEVEKEGADEMKIYDNFSCFCKDKTKRLTKMVKHHAKEIDLASSDIADKTAETNNLRAERKDRLQKHEEFSADHDDYERRLDKEQSNWANTASTFSNDKSLVLQALDSLKAAKKTANSFLQMGGIPSLHKILDIADAMGLMIPPKHKAAAASLLQSQGSLRANPMEGYGYHGGSDDIIDLVEEIWGQMQDLNRKQEEDHAHAVNSFRDMIMTLKRKISGNKDAIGKTKQLDSKLTKEIAEHRLTLIENKEDLKDTEDVLKQVTSACESRAREYDARFGFRKKELVALNTALKALSNSYNYAKKHAGSLLQTEPILKSKSSPLNAIKSLPKPNHTAQITEPSVTKAKAPPKVSSKPPSFLQQISTESSEASSSREASRSSEDSSVERGELSQEDRKKKALAVILSEGRRVKSLMLTSLALHADDPFAKVKRLIEDLRWRLEAEEHAEVDKKVWCDEELAKAEHERGYQLEVANDLNGEIVRLEAREDTLKEDIKRHIERAKEIAASIVKIYTDVTQLSKAQIRMMEDQKLARDEINYAIRLIRSFYSKAAAAAGDSLLQESSGDKQDPDTTLEDFRKERFDIHSESKQRAKADDKRQDARRKRQRERIGDLDGDVPATARMGSLGDAIALMETISADFDREIGNLEGRLDAEHQELVRTNAALREQKRHAEELTELDKQDLATTQVTKKQKFDDLKTAVNLCDSALKQLETLRPTCIDTGMSYSDRVKARETEMEAMRKALCILGETDKEFNC